MNNVQDFQIEMLTQKIAFAEQQVQDRDSELEHYKALVDTLSALVFGHQGPSPSQPPPSFEAVSAATQEQETSEVEVEQEEFISKSYAEHDAFNDATECSLDFDGEKNLSKEPLPLQKSSSRGSNSKTLKGRKSVSFHESVQVHYFGVTSH